MSAPFCVRLTASTASLRQQPSDYPSRQKKVKGKVVYLQRFHAVVRAHILHKKQCVTWAQIGNHPNSATLSTGAPTALSTYPQAFPQLIHRTLRTFHWSAEKTRRSLFPTVRHRPHPETGVAGNGSRGKASRPPGPRQGRGHHGKGGSRVIEPRVHEAEIQPPRRHSERSVDRESGLRSIIPSSQAP